MRTVEITNGNGDRFYWRRDIGLVDARQLDRQIHDAWKALNDDDDDTNIQHR